MVSPCSKCRCVLQPVPCTYLVPQRTLSNAATNPALNFPIITGFFIRAYNAYEQRGSGRRGGANMRDVFLVERKLFRHGCNQHDAIALLPGDRHEESRAHSALPLALMCAAKATINANTVTPDSCPHCPPRFRQEEKQNRIQSQIHGPQSIPPGARPAPMSYPGSIPIPSPCCTFSCQPSLSSPPLCRYLLKMSQLCDYHNY